MNILAIDTTCSTASVAVMKSDKSITTEHNDKKMNHLQNLISMIDDVLTKCKLTINDLTHIAISEGPGSFTGIRIGAATGKMLAQVLELGIIPVPTLTAYAYAAKYWDGIICPMLDARRSQVYAAAYRWENGKCFEIVKGDAYTLQEMLALVDKEGRILYIGDGTEAYQNQIEDYHGGHALQANDSPVEKSNRQYIGTLKLAHYVCEIAYEKMLRDEIVDVFEFKPVYMRKAEAERKLEEKNRCG